ncbi:hypothetical protein JCM8547_001460 [Rhodosporidiobolus lusitaniae]
MSWNPPPGTEAYYSLPSPSSTHSTLSQLLHRPPNGDPTWGRDSLPRSAEEEGVKEEYGARDGRVYLDGKGEGEISEWVSYQVWEPKDGVEKKEADIVWCHGINDYGGKFSVHAPFFLDKGYRVVVPDLPSHGRSTGMHVHLESMEKLADAVYEVVKDVALSDSQLVQEHKGAAGETHTTQKRKIFIAGQSLGGFTAVYTCLKYGTPTTTSLPPSSGHDSTHTYHPTLSGGIFLCPMLAISPESRPSYLVELAARGLSAVAGALPFAEANKGKNTEDPSVEEEFQADPQTYHGKLRIASGLAILKGLIDVNSRLSSLTLPFLLCHGTGDRVTSPSGSQLLHSTASTAEEEKEIKLYEGYEHILLRKGRDERDDVRRMRVLGDVGEWLERH